MVDRDEFMKILDDQRKKFTHKDVARFFKGWNKTMQYYFTDLDEYYVIELVDGIPKPIVQEKLEKPDIMYTMSTETFLALNKGEISGFKAYQQGKLIVKATMPEIMKLQKLDKLQID